MLFNLVAFTTFLKLSLADFTLNFVNCQNGELHTVIDALNSVCIGFRSELRCQPVRFRSPNYPANYAVNGWLPFSCRLALNVWMPKTLTGWTRFLESFNNLNLHRVFESFWFKASYRPILPTWFDSTMRLWMKCTRVPSEATFSVFSTLSDWKFFLKSIRWNQALNTLLTWMPQNSRSQSWVGPDSKSKFSSMASKVRRGMLLVDKSCQAEDCSGADEYSLCPNTEGQVPLKRTQMML